MTVDSVTVTGAPAGVTTNPAFDGTSDTIVAADVAIADGVTHVYTVVVEATVDEGAVTFGGIDVRSDDRRAEQRLLQHGVDGRQRRHDHRRGL